MLDRRFVSNKIQSKISEGNISRNQRLQASECDKIVQMIQKEIKYQKESILNRVILTEESFDNSNN